MALGFLLGVIMFSPLVPWWARKLGGSWDDPSGDVLIVLGGASLEDNVLGVSSYWRSTYAVRAQRSTPFAQIVISGGGPTHPALAMREFVVCEGVPRERVVVEDRSVSTRENALFVRELLAHTAGRKVLLTSDYHMFRAYRTFRKAGLDVLPRPFPDAIKRSGSHSQRWPIFIDLCEEAAKTAYYFVRGWI
jgi:uncharacterized SAM-binding protein YcdF (DUF218 family)